MSLSGDTDEAYAMQELRRIDKGKWKRNATKRPLAAGEMYLTTDSIADKHNIPKSKLLRDIRAGLLAAFRGPANKWLVHPADLETYKQARAV